MESIKISDLDVLAMLDLYSDKTFTPSPLWLANLFDVCRQTIVNKTKRLEDKGMLIRIARRTKSNLPLKTHKITPKGIRTLKE